MTWWFRRLYAHYTGLGRDRQIRLLTLLCVALALAVRATYAAWNVTDFWGDAYHHWLISRLTLANRWTYSDYKGMETI